MLGTRRLECSLTPRALGCNCLQTLSREFTCSRSKSRMGVGVRASMLLCLVTHASAQGCEFGSRACKQALLLLGGLAPDLLYRAIDQSQQLSFTLA